MRTIIAGSREVSDHYHTLKRTLHREHYDLVRQAIKESGFNITSVISGDAYGPDKLGAIWASVHLLPIVVMRPDWQAYGRKAGMIRNAQMALQADALIAIWDGQSAGTRGMIEIAKKRGLQIYVLHVEYQGGVYVKKRGERISETVTESV